MLQIIHDEERDLSLSEENDDDEEENQGNSKEGKQWSALCPFFYRELTCFLIYPTINVFPHCSLHVKQQSILKFHEKVKLSDWFAVWILAAFEFDFEYKIESRTTKRRLPDH